MLHFIAKLITTAVVGGFVYDMWSTYLVRKKAGIGASDEVMVPVFVTAVAPMAGLLALWL